MPASGMTRVEMLKRLAGLIVDGRRPHPVRVAIDGIDAAGKTALADELTDAVKTQSRPVIRATIDSFHKPRSERYRRGRYSPEGYYHDSFDYESVRDELLEQLGPGGSLRFRTATFEYRSDSLVYEALQTASSDAVLLFDGIFLFSPELNDYWDFRIFIDVGFEVSLGRALQRCEVQHGSVEGVRKAYESRYIPGRRLYLDEVEPRTLADVALDNNDLDRPVLHIESTS